MLELCLDGLTDLPAGKIASIVTSLEMSSPPPQLAADDRPDLALKRVEAPEVAWYRELYSRIGTDLLWFSRRRLDDAALAAILNDAGIEVFVLTKDGREVGLVEFDRRNALDIELAFFGLTPELTGKGAGRWMMARALEIGWSYAPHRVWVHTCTLDHPAALGFYVRCGFHPYRRSIEVVDDPRLTGIMARDAAAQIPII